MNKPSAEYESIIYTVVAKEIAEKQIQPALWTKAFSQSDGDEKKALALYIRLRIPQVEKELTTAVEMEKTKRQILRQQAERQRAENIKRKINPVRAVCPHCRAAFFLFPKQFGKELQCRACRRTILIPSPYE